MTEPDGAADARLAAARAALPFVEAGTIIGVGTGRAAAAFVEMLADSPVRPRAAVASSSVTAARLREVGIGVVDLPDDGRLPLYVDGADQADRELRLLKGRGGALAREKVLASAAALFVCIVEQERAVTRLTGPVPVEVLPMAASYVMRALGALGATCTARAGFVTDNGNVIVDADGLDLSDPLCLEGELAAIAGVVECGIFARRPTDVLFVGSPDGSVRELRRPGE